MGIVAGLDSSPDFTRIVVCDADTRCRAAAGVRAAPGAERRGRRGPPRSTRRPGCSRSARRPSGGLLEGVQAIGVSAQQHGLRAAGRRRATPYAPRWSAATSGRRSPAADLIDALGGPRGVGARRWARCRRPRSRWRSCAGWRSTSRTRRSASPRLLQPHDWLVWQLLGRPGAPDHRPGRRLGHRLLVGGDRRVPAGPGRAGARPPGRAARGARRPPSRPGTTPGGAADLGRDRRDHGRGLRARASGSGDAVVSLGASGLGHGRAPRGAGRPDRA